MSITTTDQSTVKDDFTEATRRVPVLVEVKVNQQRGVSLRKEPEMAYKKPQIVAKSAPKQSFVAGCPSDKAQSGCHNSHNRMCEIAQKL